MSMEQIYAEEISNMSLQNRKIGSRTYEKWNEVFYLSASLNEITVELTNTVLKKYKNYTNIGYFISTLGGVALVFGTGGTINVTGIMFIFLGIYWPDIFKFHITKIGTEEYLIRLLETGKAKEKTTEYDDFVSHSTKTEDSFKFDSSRFKTKEQQSYYEQMKENAFNPKYSKEERAKFMHWLWKADSGEIEGIEALPPPQRCCQITKSRETLLWRSFY